MVDSAAEVVGDTPEGNRRGDDAGAVPGAIIADRQDDVRGALFAGDQHGAHRRGVAQGFRGAGTRPGSFAASQTAMRSVGSVRMWRGATDW